MNRGIFCISMLVGLSALVSAGPQETDLAEKLYRSGERAYASKTYAEALDTWTQLVQQVPRSPQAPWALLRMARHQVEVDHRPQAALALLDRLRQEYLDSPAAPEALLLRGQLLTSLAKRPQDLRDAMAEFNRVSDLFPNTQQALEAKVGLGQAHLDQDQPSKALPLFLDPVQADPETPTAAQGLLGAATALDRLGDTKGGLTLLQRIQERHPQSPEAIEARWRLKVIVRHRLQKPPWRSQGSWPAGRTRWLKTPTLLASGLDGDLYIYQDDLDQISRLRANQLTTVGPSGKNAKAFAAGPNEIPWLLIPKTGAIRDNGSTLAIPGLSLPSGGFVDRWGTLWIGDAKASSLTLVAPEGTTRSIPSPAAAGLVSLPSGGAAVASDANRSLLFLDANGQTRMNVPYGRGLPASFKTVVALASDPLGHVAALVEGGDFEGLVLWGPDGTVLRHATYKALGISGRFRALALDREGGVILADRSNDLLIRIE
jgi:TolA-binding protein